MAIGLYGPERLQYAGGGPAANTQVFVFLPGTTQTAVIYADPAGLTTASNPTWTDHNGELTFFAAMGNYDLVANGARTPVTVSTPVDSGGVTESDLILATRYEFTQANPSLVWIINHPLGYRPAGIRVIETTNQEIYGSVDYPSVSQVRITFSAPTAGMAYLS